MKTPRHWFVYILRCDDGRLYTGMTGDIERRLREHKGGKGARFTRSFGVKELLFSEGHASRGDAMRREAEIKRWTKEKKFALINTFTELSMEL